MSDSELRDIIADVVGGYLREDKKGFCEGCDALNPMPVNLKADLFNAISEKLEKEGLYRA